MRIRRGVFGAIEAIALTTGRGCVRVAIACAVMLVSTAARAQAVDVSGIVSATVGYGISQLQRLDQPPRQPIIGPFLGANGGLLVTYDTPRTSHKLAYNLSVTLPINADFTIGGRPVNLINRFTYQVAIPLDPRSDIAFDVFGTTQPINSSVLAQDVALTSIENTPTGLSYNVNVGAAESFTRELTEDTDLAQSLTATYNVPFTPNLVSVKTLSFQNLISLSKDWTTDTGAIQLGNGYVAFSDGEDATGILEANGRVFNSLRLIWQRPWTPLWSTSADVGVSQAFSTDAVDRQLWQPTGGVRVLYTREPVSGILSYTYGVQVSPLSATAGYTHQANLQVAVPFEEYGLSLAALGGYSYGRPIGNDASLGVANHIFLADVALRYVPPSVPWISVLLRGLASYQQPSDDPLGGVRRLSATLSVTFTFPGVRAADRAASFFPSVYTPAPVLGVDLRRQEEAAPEPTAIMPSPPSPPVVAPPAPAKPAPSAPPAPAKPK